MNASHFPSLELCKKLTEIGFPIGGNVLHYDGSIRTEEDYRFAQYACYACPSVMEMLDVIPERISLLADADSIMKLNERYQQSFWFECDKTGCLFRSLQNDRKKFDDRKTLPDNLSECVLWLHSNSHITFDNPTQGTN